MKCESRKKKPSKQSSTSFILKSSAWKGLMTKETLLVTAARLFRGKKAIAVTISTDNASQPVLTVAIPTQVAESVTDSWAATSKHTPYFWNGVMAWESSKNSKQKNKKSSKTSHTLS